MVDTELLHLIGGLTLGAAVYQYSLKKKDEKINWTYLLLSAIAGYIFVEFILHRVLG